MSMRKEGKGFLRFNTASGMDCMQSYRKPKEGEAKPVSIPQAVWIACNYEACAPYVRYDGFNTASGMDCMQSKRNLYGLKGWKFQYRKRYGLHAIERS